jgi:hypothetical protein
MVSVDRFRQELLVQIGRALDSGAGNVLINAPYLYRAGGGNPGSSQEMPSCCDAMQGEMQPGDLLLVERTSPAGMTVRYFLPRNAP